MNTAQVKNATLYPQTHRSGNVTWKVCIGKKIDGRQDIRSFSNESEARNFAADWNSKLLEQNKVALSDLSQFQRHEILAALAKLEPYGATIRQAVDFYIKYALPPKGNITVDEALDLFLRAKERIGRRDAYLRSCRKSFIGPFVKSFPERLISSITKEEINRYLDDHKDWNGTTRASHIQYLSTFYRFLQQLGYVTLNPLERIEKPKRTRTRAKVLSPEDARKLLQFSVEKYKSECACMVLVLFCGVRVEEVERLNWDAIDFNRKIVTIDSEHTKNSERRVNPIPPNAMEWLKLRPRFGKNRS